MTVRIINLTTPISGKARGQVSLDDETWELSLSGEVIPSEILLRKGAFSQVAMKRVRGLKGLHLHTTSTRAEGEPNSPTLARKTKQSHNAVTWRNYLAVMWDKGYSSRRLLGKQNQVPIRQGSS